MDRDADTMRRVQQGELAAFGDLVHRHQQALYRYARGVLQHRELAEEAVQETFLNIFRSRDRFNPELPFRGWLWRILVNQCHQVARREFRRLPPDCWQPPAELPCAADVVAQQEQQQVLQGLLDRLPEEQQQVVRLRFFAELTFEEIAIALEIPLATAKSRVRYALAKLSQWLAPADSLNAGQVSRQSKQN